MFALRGVAVSSAVFVMVYSILSLAVCFTWRRVYHYLQPHTSRRVANVLFAVRLFPFITAAVITAAFTVPSFLLLEPRAIEEPVGAVPLALGLCGAVLALFGIGNAIASMLRASRTISIWSANSEPALVQADVPVLRIQRPTPAMTAAGILAPRLLVSTSAERSLSEREMQIALRHEIAHVRRRDNLRKLLFRFVAFPGMRSLEVAWLEATEMAADDAAVSNAVEALDLAAALIKLSRLSPNDSVDLTAALIHSSASLMNARIKRLITWSDKRTALPQALSIRYGLGAACITLVIFSVVYTHLLFELHTATEWLMR